MNVTKIQGWMNENSQTSYSIAKELGLSQTYFYNMLKGNHYPGIHLCYIICRFTNEHIQPADIYDEYSGKDVDRKLVEHWLREGAPWEVKNEIGNDSIDLDAY